MIRAVQLEWIFLQRVTKNTGYTFVVVEKLLWETLFMCLFLGKLKYLTPLVENLGKMMVNKASLGLQNLVASKDKKYLSLQRASTELI